MSTFDLGTEYHCICGHMDCPLPKGGTAHMYTRNIKLDTVTVIVWYCDAHRLFATSATIDQIIASLHPKVAYRGEQLRKLIG